MALNFLLIPAASLMPLIITRVFDGGAAQLGLTESLFGVGMIAGGITLSIRGGFKRRIITSFCGVIGIGLGTVVAGLVSADMFYLLLAGWFIAGFSQVFANGPLMAIMQSIVTPDMQGAAFIPAILHIEDNHQETLPSASAETIQKKIQDPCNSPLRDRERAVASMLRRFI